MRAVTIMGRFVRDDDPCGRGRRSSPGDASHGPVGLGTPAGGGGPHPLRGHAAPLWLRAGRWPLSPSADPLARRLHEATAMLTAGRDLLQTNYGPAFSRARHYSEWGPVITSPPATRALLTEIGSLAQRTRATGSRTGYGPLPWKTRNRGPTAPTARRLPVAVGARQLSPGRPPARTGAPARPRAAERDTQQHPPAAPVAQLCRFCGRLMRGSDCQRRTGPSPGLGVCGTCHLVTEHDRDIPAPSRRGQHRHQPQLRAPASVSGCPHRAQRVRRRSAPGSPRPLATPGTPATTGSRSHARSARSPPTPGATRRRPLAARPAT